MIGAAWVIPARAAEVLSPAPAVVDTSAAARAPGSVASAARARGPSPTGALFRSLVVPGWGQFANGKYVKAAIIGLGEGALVWGMVAETQRAEDAREASRRAATEKERLAAVNDKERHLLRRDDYGWWMLAVVLYSIADAYVDAHLAGYDDEWTLEASVTGRDAARAGVRVAF